MTPLRYEVDLSDVRRRLLHFRLRCEVTSDKGGSAEVFLPVWTPGSYLVREFARLVRDVRARTLDGGEVACAKRSKNRWRVPVLADGTLDLRWSVYARDLTVRTSYVQPDLAFWNAANVLLWPIGAGGQPARDCSASLQIRLAGPDQLVFAGGIEASRVSALVAEVSLADLDHAMDTPVLVGGSRRCEVAIDGVPHHFVAAGLEPFAWPANFPRDLRSVLEVTAAVFGGSLPFTSYAFLSLFSDQGHGGLEHCDSSVLLAPRHTFDDREEYEDFLSLIAHEYLHAWNVKRMRPREFWNYDYETENPTRLLWVAEGFTAYFDDLLCRRAGVMSVRRYLSRLASHVDAMLDNPGRRRLSLGASSFDAWLLLYRPDESTRNVSQNYYTNGALAAFLIDAAIRRASAGTRTLDDAVRALWASTWQQGRGYDFEDVIAAIDQAAGRSLASQVEAWIEGPFDPDVDAALELFGLRLDTRASTVPEFGVRFDVGSTRAAAVKDGSPADLAGVFPSDEILAIDGLRVEPKAFDSIWTARAKSASKVAVLLARRGKIETIEVEPGSMRPGKVSIVGVDLPTSAQLAHRQSWLLTTDLGG
ncbi:MAG: M61 family metallopeptidase [Planctomycetota bacterium]